MRTIATVRIRGLALAGALAAAGVAAAPLHAQEAERFAFTGGPVAIYNLAGRLVVEPSESDAVVVEVRRGGEDAATLRVRTGELGGRQTLRVVYPGDRVVYGEIGRRTQTRLRVDEDGTFVRGRSGGRRVTITGDGRGTVAHADLRVRVPEGGRVAVHLGAGAAVVANVAGELLVDNGSGSITAEGTRGWLRLDTGSGRVRVSDAEGEVEVDTGSGSVEVRGIRGRRLLVDTGSGSVRGEGIHVEALNVDTGSGRIEIQDVRARTARLDTGSGGVELGLRSEIENLDIDTGSGSVTITVPTTLGGRIEVDTGSGGIDVEDLPLRVMEQRRSYLLGRLGEGGGSIRIETGSGRVRVRGV